jgi:hypothetical protein
MSETKALYACCPVCAKTIGRSKRIDGLEITCSKCGSPLKLNIDLDAKVSVELLGGNSPGKVNRSSVAP